MHNRNPEGCIEKKKERKNFWYTLVIHRNGIVGYKNDDATDLPYELCVIFLNPGLNIHHNYHCQNKPFSAS